MKKKLAGVAIAAALAVVLAGCSSGGSGDQSADGAKKVQKASILMNWFAQAEQGGYWAAKAEGIAKKHGISLTIKQGGPGIQTNPQIASGKADFGVGNADEVIQASAQGLPLVAVAASFQHSLQGMLYHKSSGISGFDDLKGHTVARMPLPYWSYIRGKFNLEGKIHEVNLQSLASFKSNPDLVLQCYITSEPFALEESGVKDVGVLTSAKDAGYDPYQNVLYTTRSFIDQHPDIVKAVVQSSVEGWKAMLEDPTKTKKAIMKANPDGDEYVLDKAIAMMQDDPSLLGKDIGTFSKARWEKLRDQLASIDVVPEDFDVTKAYTTKFLPE